MSASNAGSDRQTARGLISGGVNAPLAIAGVALAIYTLGFAGPYDLRLLTICGVQALLVLGFQFIFGHAGAVSLAQSAFFGVGAYSTGILATRYDAGFLLTFPAAILLSSAIAALVAVPVLRLDEHYFALATLVLSLLLLLVAVEWEAVTGGTNGLPGIPSVKAFGVEIATRRGMLEFVWVWVGLGALLAFQVTRGLYGQAFHLMRESQLVASTLGIDVARLRFTAFVLSAAYAGAAGALMVHVVHVVSPEALDLSLMVTCLTMTVIGGRLQIAGAILGAILITYLREQFRALLSFDMILYALVTLGFLILAPYGLVGALQRTGLFRRTTLALPRAATEPAGAWAPTGALLSVAGISKAFGGVQALQDVEFDLHTGQIVGLIGPNGSGKTTLINVISGVTEPDAGRVTLAGKDIAGCKPVTIAGLGVARTFQHVHLVGDMTVLDNIALARTQRERSGLWQALLSFGPDRALRRARSHAMRAVETLGIASVALAECAALPYGTRRRVEVARALAAAPRLLLLDEPAAGLNEEEQRDLAARIRRIAAGGVTVLVVEHNLVFLSALVEHLICLERGRVIASGHADAVRADPLVIEAYLGTPD